MKAIVSNSIYFFFLKILVYLLERGERRERKRERDIEDVPDILRWVASCMPPTGDLAHDPGMCPDWELNPQPFSS